MSLYGALYAGVSGLQAHSSNMGAIADNITNVNTSGFKETEVNFQTLVTKQVSLTKYSAGGVQALPRRGVDIQGLLQATSSATDMALSGQGLFVVNEAANPGSGDLFAYTRAGSFRVDKEGNLQNASGWYLQGWPLQTWDGNQLASRVTVGDNSFMKSYVNQSGDTVYINDNIVDGSNLRPLNVTTIGGTAENTTTVGFGANLPKGAEIGDTEKLNLQIYDSLGTAHNLDYTIEKVGTNAWTMDVLPPDGSASLALERQDSEVYLSAARIDFDADQPIANGSSMTVNVNGQEIVLNFNNNPDTLVQPNNDPAIPNPTPALPATLDINISSRSLGQTLDRVADVLDTLFGRAAGFGDIPANGPANWVDRISGTNSLVLRQGSDAAALNISVGAMVNADNERITTQGRTEQGGLYSAPPLSPGNNWTDDVTSIRFNGDGTPQEFFGLDQVDAPDPQTRLNINWANGSDDMDDTAEPKITQSMGNYNSADGLTQFDGQYQINHVSQNGSKFGNFAGVSIGQDGVVTALFDNGVSRPVFQVPVVTFVNPNGLEALTGNVFVETDRSGEPTVRTATEGGAGGINSASLEGSTVDLATQFTSMITNQKGYSASAKLISTTDQMLDELMQTVR